MRTTFVSEAATAEALPPNAEFPHTTTDPSVLTAAKAFEVEEILVTPEVSEAATALLSPPLTSSPHVITLPSDLMAANAYKAEAMETTPPSRAEHTLPQLPP
jgi:hypothetical protein